MEKISRILPPSSRVTAADSEASPPARPGSPTFGRKKSDVASKVVEDKVSISQTALDRANGKLNVGETAGSESKEAIAGAFPSLAESKALKEANESAKVKVITDLNRKFFNNVQAEVGSKSDSNKIPRRKEDVGDLPEIMRRETPELDSTF